MRRRERKGEEKGKEKEREKEEKEKKGKKEGRKRRGSRVKLEKNLLVWMLKKSRNEDHKRNAQAEMLKFLVFHLMKEKGKQRIEKKKMKKMKKKGGQDNFFHFLYTHDIFRISSSAAVLPSLLSQENL